MFDPDEIEDMHKRLFEHYLEIGAVELASVDDSGEFIYEVKEISKEIAPELWEAHTEYVESQLLELYEAGLVSIQYDENLEATFTLSEEGKNKAKELGLFQMGDEG